MTTLAVNLANKAPTQLLGHTFNSYANIGGNYIAASADGLFRIGYGGSMALWGDDLLDTDVVDMTHNGEESSGSVVLDAGEYCYEPFAFETGGRYRVTYTGTGTAIHQEYESAAFLEAIADELVTNGTFDTDTSGWTPYLASLSVDSGGLKIENTDAYGRVWQSFSTVIGQIYKFTTDADEGTSPGYCTIQARDGSGYGGTSIVSLANQRTGALALTFKATSITTSIVLQTQSTTVGHYTLFDNISVKPTQNLVENGELSTDRKFTKGTGWTISGGKANGAAGTASHLQQNGILPAIGNEVTVSVVTSGISAGSVTPYAGSGGAGTPITTNTTSRQELTVTTDTNFSLYKSADFVGSVDDVIVYAGGDEEFGAGTSVSLPHVETLTATNEDMVSLRGGTVESITVERLDDSEIDASFKTVSTDFGISNPKRGRFLYIGYEADGDLSLDVYADEVHVGTYSIPAGKTGQQYYRVPLNRTAYGRYWEFKFSNVDGADFSIDSVDVLPIKLNQRLR